VNEKRHGHLIYRGRCGVSGVVVVRCQTTVKSGDRNDSTATIDKVMPLMRVLLAQGIIYYAYKADSKDAVDKAATTSDRSRGCTYAAALLPAVDACNPKAATTSKSTRQRLAALRTGSKPCTNAMQGVPRALASPAPG
jgi:hypothetical protein